MIARFINGFVAILIAVVLVGPVSDTVSTSSALGTTLSNVTGGTATTYGWGATVLRIVPGLFAVAILAIGVAVLYGNLKDAGMA